MRKFLASVLLLMSVNAMASNLNGTDCTLSFSPKGSTTTALVNEIASAKHSIYIMAYSFTSDPIANALVDAKKRGVDVNIVADKSNLSGKRK